MFDIGWSELVVIGVVALVVIGPKDLPRVMRTVGQWSGKARRVARDFQNQFNEAVREAELEDVRKDIADISAGVKKDMAAIDSHVAAASTPRVVPPPSPAPLMTPLPTEAAPPTPAPAAEEKP